MKRRTSNIWQFYTKIDKDSVKCNVCNKNYSNKGRGTTPLKNHLRSMHVEEYNEFVRVEQERNDSTSVNVTVKTDKSASAYGAIYLNDEDGYLINRDSENGENSHIPIITYVEEPSTSSHPKRQAKPSNGTVKKMRPENHRVVRAIAGNLNEMREEKYAKFGAFIASTMESMQDPELEKLCEIKIRMVLAKMSREAAHRQFIAFKEEPFTQDPLTPMGLSCSSENSEGSLCGDNVMTTIYPKAEPKTNRKP